MLMSAASRAGVHLSSVGRFGGDAVRLGGSSAPLAELAAIYRNSFAEALG